MLTSFVELRFENAVDHNSFDEVGFLVSKDDAKEGTEMMTVQDIPPEDIPWVCTFEEQVHLTRLSSAAAHDRFFQVLYHVMPEYSADRCIARSQMLMTYQVARLCGSEDLIRHSIERHLLDQRAEVLEDCARQSAELMCFAYSLKIDWVFKEAATVLISLNNTDFNGFPYVTHWDAPQLTPWVYNKRLQFVAKLLKIELALRGLQPMNFTCANCTYARNFYQDWLTRRLARGEGSGLLGRYASIYHFLHHRKWVSPDPNQPFSIEIQDFIAQSNLPVVDDLLRPHINELFDRATAVVAEIMKDATLRGGRLGDLPAFEQAANAPAEPLKFMKIEDHELPWAPQPQPVAAPAAAPAPPAQQN